MRKFKVGFGLLIAAVMLVGMVGVGWGVPNLINVQGRLVDKATGQPVANQTLDVTVNYYNAETGGTLLSGSGYGYSPATDSNGVFNIILSGVPDFTAEDYYVEFVVGARIGGTWRMETIPDPTLPSPANKRQRLVAVPFAITARNVRGGTVVATSNYENGKVISGVNSTTTYGTGIFGETFCNVGQSLLLGHAGVYGSNRSDGAGVRGHSVNGTGIMGSGVTGGIFGWGTGTGAYGVFGSSAGTATSADPSLGAGVVGKNTQTTIPTGRTASPGVYGESISGYGVYGRSTTGIAVYGTTNSSPGVYGFGADGVGVVGVGTSFPTGYTEDSAVRSRVGVRGLSNLSYGVEGISTTNSGVRGESASGYGVLGYGATSTGVYGVSGSMGVRMLGSIPTGHGVVGEVNSTTKAGVYGNNINSGYGVYGLSANGQGVHGDSANGYGVYGDSTNGAGVYGFTSFGDGVYGFGGNSRGVHGKNNSSTSAAIYAENMGPGDNLVNGNEGPALEIAAGKIKIASSTGAGSSTAKNNTAAGTVSISGSSSIGTLVYNSYVTADSIILLTQQSGTNLIPLKVGSRSAGNYFYIVWSGTAAAGTSVGYLIIN